MLYQNHQRALGCEGIWRSQTLKPEFTRSSSWTRKKRNEPESRGNLPCDAQTEGAANSRVYAGGNLSREERFGENSEGFTTLSINADLFHLEEETESQYGNLITTSSQDLLREGRITQGRIGKLKASGPSDRS